MQHRTKILSGLALAGLALSATALSAPGPGDQERVVIYTPRPAGQLTIAPCPLGFPCGTAQCGAHHERFELWDQAAYTPNGLPWFLFVSGANQDIAPGFFSCGSPTTAPGYDAVVAAARVWNDIPWPTSCPTKIKKVDPTPIPGGTPIGPITVTPIPIGPPGGGGLPSTVASEFAFANDPLLTTNASEILNNTDGRNVVALWDNEGFFNSVGGASIVLGVTRVRLQGSVTQPNFAGIVEADIALNASGRAASGGQAYFSWVQSNPNGTVSATYNTASPTMPIEGFCDIVGILAHEFGHAAGLGHSVVDGRAGPNGGQFPTMFPRAQVQKFFETVEFQDSVSCAVTSTQVWDGSTTNLSGILGRAAASLEPDDIAAIGRGYPSADFAGSTGTISGRIPNVEGASIVAIRANCPPGPRRDPDLLALPRSPGPLH